MIFFVKKIIEGDEEITPEVRNLLSIAYKSVVSANRSAWRAISNFEEKEKNKDKVSLFNSKGFEPNRNYKLVSQKNRIRA